MGFSKGVTEGNNLLHLKELGADLGTKILQYWLEDQNRSLTNYQVSILSFSFSTFSSMDCWYETPVCHKEVLHYISSNFV